MKYSPINGWTKTKILDHIKSNFRGKSINDDDKCLYRGPEGRKCAVGLFIPDENYDPSMEDITATTFFDKYGNEKFMPLQASGMLELQRVHDSSESNYTLSSIIYWINANVEEN